MARQILEDAENDLRGWEPSVEPITNAMGRESPTHANGVSGVNGHDEVVSEHQSDVLENVSVTEGFTQPVGSGALPAKMVVEPEPSPA